MSETESNNKQQDSKLESKSLNVGEFDIAWHQSLSFKFILIVILLLSLLMGIFAYINYHSEVKKLNIELQAKGETLARLTSLTIVESILAFDMAEVEKSAESLNQEPDVAYVVMHSDKNENITNYIDLANPLIKEIVEEIKSQNINDVVAALSKNKLIEQISVPIKYQELNLGRVVVGMSRENLNSKSNKFLYQKLFETLLLIFIMSITIFIVFKASTIEPIRKLLKGLQNISNGKFDYRVDVNDKNEIGSLSRSFNRMAEDLKQTQNDKESALLQLENLNNDLALDIEKRSHALTEVNKELEFIAMHDSLTQLPNRNSFFKKIDSAIEGAISKKSMIGLIMLDLDRFKEINETLGHDVGDEILVTISERLKESTRGDDCVARIGSDEFIVLINSVNLEQLEIVAKKFVNVIQSEVKISDQSFYITASMGLSLYPMHAGSPNELLRCADIAMYEAKEKKDDYAIYNPTFEAKKIRHVDLLGGLRVAIHSDQLFLEYQPKIDINRGVAAGVEALVRWKHPERGIIPPYEFIGLAENTGLIKPLTAWVLNEAIRQNGVWHKDGLELTVSVNLSMLNLEDETLPDYIRSLLEKHDLPANRLILEVTETTIMANPKQVMETLTKLHAMGIYLSIDDFGTGYSSLAYLHKLPVDEIKIDRSFVLSLNNENMNKSIVHSIIELGHNLSLSVVAEGVEDAETVLLLSKLKCDVIQGYFFSKPLPSDDLRNFCNKPVAADSFKVVTGAHSRH